MWWLAICSLMFWTDWNREAPKIEKANMDGTNRRSLVTEGLALPNGLTIDYQSSQVCWADAGKSLCTNVDSTILPCGIMQRTILLSQFCLSVCLSVRCVYCDKTKWCTAAILIPNERAITLVFWHQQWLVGDGPFPLKSALKVTHPFEKRRLRPISAYNVSTVRDSEKSSITTNIKWPRAFLRAIDGVCILPLSPERVIQKGFFSFFGTKVNFNRREPATKFLCVKLPGAKL